MKTSPQTKLEAQLNCITIKGIFDAVHVKSGWLILKHFPSSDNPNLPEVIVNMPILGLIDVGQKETLDIFYPIRIELRREHYEYCINDTLCCKYNDIFSFFFKNRLPCYKIHCYFYAFMDFSTSDDR